MKVGGRKTLSRASLFTSRLSCSACRTLPISSSPIHQVNCQIYFVFISSLALNFRVRNQVMKDTPRVLELRPPSGRRDWECNSYNSKNGKPNQRLWLKRRKALGRRHHLFCSKRSHLNPSWNYPYHLGLIRCYEKSTSIFMASFGISYLPQPPIFLSLMR